MLAGKITSMRRWAESPAYESRAAIVENLVTSSTRARLMLSQSRTLGKIHEAGEIVIFHLDSLWTHLCTGR